MATIIIYLIYPLIMMHNTALGSITATHAIYVSVIEIEFDQDNYSGSINVKIFANDLEDAIYNQTKKRVELIEGTECSSNLAIVANYFTEHLQLKINNNEIDYSIETCEVNDISIWYTFSFKSNEACESVEIMADYLIELFPTQSNVVNITVDESKKMFRLTKGTTSEIVEFQP